MKMKMALRLTNMSSRPSMFSRATVRVYRCCRRKSESKRTSVSAGFAQRSVNSKRKLYRRLAVFWLETPFDWSPAQ